MDTTVLTYDMEVAKAVSKSRTYNPQGDIAVLMTLYDQAILPAPQVPDRQTLLLRARLIFEEALEFVVAAGCEVGLAGDGSLLDKTTMVVGIDPTIEPNLVEMVDAVTDTLVVTYGAANAIGLFVPPAWDEVQRSNLSKVWPDGTIHKREDGKVIKPDTYSAADLASVVKKQQEAATA
jgi:predicted HAD superfamily Cof-like phosphohydrolase